MNLTTDGWIPVVTERQETILASLNDIYKHAKDYCDLALNPPQRISVMRLLICITQAALHGPKDEADWMKCESSIISESLKYLAKHHDKFELYGNKPFLQVKGLTANEKKTLDKLDFSSPSTSTLFEHEAASELIRPRTSAWKALNILTLLNFHTTGKVGQAIWNNKNYNHSTYPTPCIGLTHSFIKGENLLETIYLNLLTEEEVNNMPNGKWGSPVWEQFPKTENDSALIKNATETYLGRLVPFSRLILLEEQGTQCIIGPTPETIKFKGVPYFREPSTTVVLNEKDQACCMEMNSNKHIWRDLASVLAISASLDKGAPLTLRKVNKLASYIKKNSVDFWVGGLELGGQAAKLHDMAEWNLCIPLSFFQTGTLDSYSKGVDLAENAEKHLENSVLEYYKIIVVKYRKILDIQSLKSLKSKARIDYWQTLDNQYQVLIDIVANGKSLDDEWSKIVYSAMCSAFDYACPHETPRQIQAYAQAKALLKLKKSTNTVQLATSDTSS